MILVCSSRSHSAIIDACVLKQRAGEAAGQDEDVTG